MAPPEGVGHRFSPAGDPVDPGSAPSCLRHSTSVTQAKFVGTKSPPNFPGAPGGSRTPNLFLRRELLYPLSYEGVATLYLYYQIGRNSTINILVGKLAVPQNKGISPPYPQVISSSI